MFVLVLDFRRPEDLFHESVTCHGTIEMVKGNTPPADIFTLFFYTVSGRVSTLISVSVTSMKHRTFYAG